MKVSKIAASFDALNCEFSVAQSNSKTVERQVPHRYPHACDPAQVLTFTTGLELYLFKNVEQIIILNDKFAACRRCSGKLLVKFVVNNEQSRIGRAQQ